MSIVGTRPPLPNEWEAYELHHRAKATMAIIDGMPIVKRGRIRK